MTAILGVVRRAALALALAAASAASGRAQPRPNTLYASNFGGNTVTAYDASTGAPLGALVVGAGEASGFTGLRWDALGRLVVAAQLTNNVVRYDGAGALLGELVAPGAGGLSQPQDLAFGPDGRLYVASPTNDRILRYDGVTGAFVDAFADLGAGGHIGPTGLAFGPDGNLYVTSFDDGRVVRVDGATGAVLGSTPGPPGFGLGAAAFGPDGRLFVTATDLGTFLGSVYRFDPATSAFDLFVAPGAGGLASAGGIAFGPGGALLVASIVVDRNFADAGSTVLRYDGTTGAPLGTLVAAGSGLDVPFFAIVTPAAVPEPSTLALLGTGGALLLAAARRRRGGTRP